MAYAHYRICTVDHTQCGGSDSNNFVVKLDFTDPTLKLSTHGGTIVNTVVSNGQTVPADLAFYTGLGPTGALSFEIEKYVGTTGQVVAHFKLDVLSHLIDSLVYMYCADASVTTFQGDLPGTWTPAGYKAVLHFPDGTVLSAKGSVGGHDGVITGATAAPGLIDGAASFAGGSNKISLGVSADWQPPVTQSFALSLQMKTVNGATTFLAGIYDGTISGSNFALFQLSAPGIQWYIHTLSLIVNANIADGEWHHLMGVFHFVAGVDGQMILYVDGVPSFGPTGETNPTASALTMGLDAAASIPPYVGLLDEVRFIWADVTQDWVTAEVNNQKPGSTFISVGAQQDTGGGPTPPLQLQLLLLLCSLQSLTS
jgi:hypothetical protein